MNAIVKSEKGRNLYTIGIKSNNLEAIHAAYIKKLEILKSIFS